MGVEITVQGLKASGSSEILNRMKINDSEVCDITIKQSELLNRASMLNDMEINCVVNQIEDEMKNMDHFSPEYLSLKNLSETKSEGRSEILRKIKNHLTSFAGGVLQNLISDIISGKIGF